ncbi:MAG: hypothetical protein ACRCYE_01105 [Sarcina sp.]
MKTAMTCAYGDKAKFIITINGINSRFNLKLLDGTQYDKLIIILCFSI